MIVSKKTAHKINVLRQITILNKIVTHYTLKNAMCKSYHVIIKKYTKELSLHYRDKTTTWKSSTSGHLLYTYHVHSAAISLSNQFFVFV